jgi:hypothetical protein
MEDTEGTSSDEDPTSAFRVEPQPAEPRGFLLAVLTQSALPHQAKADIDMLFAEFLSASDSTRSTDDTDRILNNIELVFDEHASSRMAQLGQLTDQEQSPRSRMAVSNLVLKCEAGHGGMVGSPEEEVWYCCRCLMNQREDPPQFNRSQLDVCERCQHRRCDSGCVKQPANTPRPIWYLLQETRSIRIWWVDGPSGWEANHFRNLGKGQFPDWYCCRCLKNHCIINAVTPLNTRTCVRYEVGYQCYHSPCSECTTTPPDIRNMAGRWYCCACYKRSWTLSKTDAEANRLARAVLTGNECDHVFQPGRAMKEGGTCNHPRCGDCVINFKFFRAKFGY